MNILPHKRFTSLTPSSPVPYANVQCSWHVYNKKNIEKVKRDEAKAREEEEAKAKRAAQAVCDLIVDY